MQWLPITTRSASCRSRPRSCTSTIVPACTISSCRPIVAKPSARLNVVTLPDPCPIGYAASDGPPLRVRRLDQSDQQVLGPADLAVDLHGQLAGTTVRSCAPRPASRANHRRDELVEREDRRGRKAGEHDHRAAAGRREADRLAGLERDAVRDDAGIVELGDDAIGDVARALAGSAREQHDVGDFQRVPQSFAQGGDVVVRDARAASARRPAPARRRRAPARWSRRPSPAASARRGR